MAKISILTFHFSNNLGAMLQAYGLAQAIKHMGHEVEVIDYRPLTIRKTCESPLWRHRHPIRLVRTALFRHRIRGFRRTFLPLSRTYLDLEALRQSPPRADCIVVGSDQVWNTKSPIRGYDPTFFLEFLGDSGPRRVSYAASFGNGTELNGHREQIGGLLGRFDRLSVRDITSKNMIRDLTGRDSEHVLDPSFLTDYDPITPPPIIKQPYILAYCFRKTLLSEHALKMLRNKLNIPIISIKVNFDGAKVVNPGPLQWLSLLRYARYICTDSFHGTCFSLINRKQFVTIPYDGGMSRLEDILQTVKLSDRIAMNKNELERLLVTPVNYDVTSVEIDKAREISLAYLRDALKI